MLIDAPFGLALVAGALAAVNPCGFALLPAYLTFLILDEENPGRPAAVRRALVSTAAMTAGFAGVFGLFGLAIAPVAGSIQRHLPWFSIALGLLLVALGGLLLAGKALPMPSLRGRGRRGGTPKPITGSVWSMAGFGASYAIASLGCTIAPFLGVVVAGFSSRSIAAGIALFVTYALGMGLVVGLAATAVALARTDLVGRLRRIGAVLPRLAGGLLMLVGGYVAYYGWYEIRVFAGEDLRDDPIIGAAAAVQSVLAGGIWWIVGLSALAIAAFVLVRGVRRAATGGTAGHLSGPQDHDFLE